MDLSHRPNPVSLKEWARLPETRLLLSLLNEKQKACREKCLSLDPSQFSHQISKFQGRADLIRELSPDDPDALVKTLHKHQEATCQKNP